MAAVYTLKILTDFAAAHYLRDYEGVCNRLHGHNWKVEVNVKARQLDKVGMGQSNGTTRQFARYPGWVDRFDSDAPSPYTSQTRASQDLS